MANAFRFRLARIQRVRELHEGLAKAEFAAALGAANQAAQYIEYLHQEIVSARASLAEMQIAGTIDVRGMIAKDKSVNAILAKLGPAKNEHHRLQNVAEIERAKWSEKKSESQALEKLEKRHRQRHFAEVAQKENEQQDEVAISRAFRRTQLEKLEQKSGKGSISPFRPLPNSPDRSGRSHSPAHFPQ